MSPIRTQSSRNLIKQEGRVLLAIQAIQKKEISIVQQAARLFNIPRTTLRRRLASTTNRVKTRANSYKLTKIKEDSLRK
jgi:predicted HTH domain antitoxin